MVKDTTLYDRLEIPPNADESQIKKAYIKLSKQWHPDKHDDDHKEEATVKFKDITMAKEVLLDNEKRNAYDNMGMDMFNNGSNGMPDAGGFGDFGNMFGGGFPFGMGGMPGMPGMQMPNMQRQPENIIEEMEVTLEQIYNEESVNFSYKQKVNCNKCNGEGTKDGKTVSCNGCGGKGMRVQIVRMGNMIQQSVGPCNMCMGKGTMIDDANKCDVCVGNCHTVKDKTIQIPLKAGLNDSDKINLSGKGHQLKNVRTDLIIVINIVPHKVFKRYHDDLFVDVELKLYQALFGFDKTVTHLDGRKLHISCSSKTDVNMIRKISGEGMKKINSNIKGDLYIRFKMTLPNYNLLPNDIKNQLKGMLISLDKQQSTESVEENQIKSVTNNVKTILCDCNMEQTEQISDLLNKLKENKPRRQRREQEESGQPGCVQQ